MCNFYASASLCMQFLWSSHAVHTLPGLQYQCCFWVGSVAWVQAPQTNDVWQLHPLPAHLPVPALVDPSALLDPFPVLFLIVCLKTTTGSSSVSISVGDTTRALLGRTPSVLSIISSASFEKNSLGHSSGSATVYLWGLTSFEVEPVASCAEMIVCDSFPRTFHFPCTPFRWRKFCGTIGSEEAWHLHHRYPYRQLLGLRRNASQRRLR